MLDFDPDDLRRWDNDHVWHPFTPMQAHQAERPPIIASADGFFLTDTDGRRYLDGISSLWCNVHGHRVPEIDQAIRDQLDSVGHSTLLGLGNVPSIRLARELVVRAPQGLTRVFYSDSGSTAVEAALKIVYQYHRQKPSPEPDRDLFLCLSQAYHGDTVGSVSVGGIDLFHRVYSSLLFKTQPIPAPACHPNPTDGSIPDCTDEDFAATERIIRQHAGHAAGLVMEPLVQGAAGILLQPNGYLSRVRKLTRELGIPLIADEVAVGFGRTGTMFACEQEQVVPDLLCLAKGISGGYLPLAATLATDEIFDAFLGKPVEGRTFFHGHTYTGNPLACAAALASLELFDTRNVLQHIQENAAIVSQSLGELGQHPHVREVRQRGMMVGIELVADKASGQAYPAELRMGHQVTLAARQQGTIIRPLGDVVVLMPAPGMPADLVVQLCRTAVDSINAACGDR